MCHLYGKGISKKAGQTPWSAFRFGLGAILAFMSLIFTPNDVTFRGWSDMTTLLSSATIVMTYFMKTPISTG